jgi:2'-phosphotransferase
MGLHVEPDGYVLLQSLLEHKQTAKAFKHGKPSEDIIHEIVRNCKKQRFMLIERDGSLYIRANQGHSGSVAEKIDPEQLLIEIDSPDKIPCVVHGTFSQNWESISRTGLNKMSRQMIHFASGLPENREVISGMRKSCDVYIYIDAASAMAAGIKFFISSNGVILSEGIDGIIAPEYFAKVEFKSDLLESDDEVQEKEDV